MKIVQLASNKTSLSVWYPTNYTFEPSGWLKGFQRLAFWFLRKTHALPHYIGTDDYITTHYIDEKQIDNLIHAFLEAKIDVFRHYNRTPTELIIGCDDFNKLMNTGDIYKYMDLKRDILGLQVKVVPWIEGWVIL